MKRLTADNREDLQTSLAEAVLSKMNHQQLEDFAFDSLLNTYDRLTNAELVTLIRTFHPELLD